MKKYNIIWIIPNLNEKLYIVKKNIKLIYNFSEDKNYDYKIILADGGSDYNKLISLKEFIKRFDKKVELNLVMPLLRPTKDKAIKDIVERYLSENVAIVDSDCVNIDKNILNKLISPLISKRCAISLPNLTKSGGRVNRLICNPLLWLLYPDVYKKMKFPLSGIIALKYDILKGVTEKKDFFWDWGGEIQIVINPNKKVKINQFVFDKLDAKKRSLSSKKDDARQILRTILYEFLKKHKSLPQKLKKEYKIYVEQRSYEDYLISEMVISTLEEILFNRKLKIKGYKEVPSKRIDKLKLEKRKGILRKIYINYVREFLLSKKSKKEFMQRCQKIIKRQIELADKKSINITNLTNKKIKELLNKNIK